MHELEMERTLPNVTLTTATVLLLFTAPVTLEHSGQQWLIRVKFLLLHEKSPMVTRLVRY